MKTLIDLTDDIATWLNVEPSDEFRLPTAVRMSMANRAFRTLAQMLNIPALYTSADLVFSHMEGDDFYPLYHAPLPDDFSMRFTRRFPIVWRLGTGVEDPLQEQEVDVLRTLEEPTRDTESYAIDGTEVILDGVPPVLPDSIRVHYQKVPADLVNTDDTNELLGEDTYWAVLAIALAYCSSYLQDAEAEARFNAAAKEEIHRLVVLLSAGRVRISRPVSNIPG